MGRVVLIFVVCGLVVGRACAQTPAVGTAQPTENAVGTAHPTQAAKKATKIAPGQGRRVFLPVDPRDEAAILAEDAQIPREQVPTGPVAELNLFGAAAQGRSFVFVIDRSNSMGSQGLGAIGAAARELAARIGKLSHEQKFQVVAYNEAAAYFSGRQLVPATEENKKKLVKYVAELPASGQTEHTRGLLAALRLKPEVIFLLTDGGDPVMSKGDLQFIRQQAGGRTSIHCVQFGAGRAAEEPSFLTRLAAENRGSYVYIDVNTR
jgi:Ca-activated chloride channel family protein